MERALDAAQGSGAQNEQQVTILYFYNKSKLNESQYFYRLAPKVVTAYRKRALKLAIILYGKDSSRLRRWREKEVSEE